jgi:hypothetical protein
VGRKTPAFRPAPPRSPRPRALMRWQLLQQENRGQNRPSHASTVWDTTRKRRTPQRSSTRAVAYVEFLRLGRQSIQRRLALPHALRAVVQEISKIDAPMRADLVMRQLTLFDQRHQVRPRHAREVGGRRLRGSRRPNRGTGRPGYGNKCVSGPRKVMTSSEKVSEKVSGPI